MSGNTHLLMAILIFLVVQEAAAAEQARLAGELSAVQGELSASQEAVSAESDERLKLLEDMAKLEETLQVRHACRSMGLGRVFETRIRVKGCWRMTKLERPCRCNVPEEELSPM